MNRGRLAGTTAQPRIASRRLARAAVLVVLAACGGGGGEPENGGNVAVTVTPENVTVVDSARIESGPAISGTLEPERSANVRAEVGGSVLQTYAERGQAVRRGDLLLRIDDSAVRDAYLSARSAVTTATESAALARRNAERAARLHAAGAVAERELESARIAQTSAESQLADARARLTLAEKQVANTQVRAPFSGVVSDRQVSAGDVVQPGSPLYTVVDPASMQLIAAVPAPQLTSVEIGAPVEFTVNGYPGRAFAGTVKRINAVADPATGQVTVIATVPNAGGDLVGGLFAEGRIGAVSRVTITAPMAAVDMGAGGANVMRLAGGVVEQVAVQVGLRDEQGERVELLSGVSAGDTLLIGAARGIAPGTPVVVQRLESRPAGN